MRVVTLLSTAAGAVDDATPVTAVTVLGPPSLEAPGLAGDAFRFSCCICKCFIILLRFAAKR